MRNGIVTQKPWFNIVSCVVASVFHKSNSFFSATHEIPKKATSNVNVYIQVLRRSFLSRTIENQKQTLKIFKNSLNVLRVCSVYFSKLLKSNRIFWVRTIEKIAYNSVGSVLFAIFLDSILLEPDQCLI